MELLSAVRLGVHLNLLDDLPPTTVALVWRRDRDDEAKVEEELQRRGRPLLGALLAVQLLPLLHSRWRPA